MCYILKYKELNSINQNIYKKTHTMGCVCKKKQEQPVVQQPPQSINLQNVVPTVTQPAAPAPPQNS